MFFEISLYHSKKETLLYIKVWSYSIILEVRCYRCNDLTFLIHWWRYINKPKWCLSLCNSYSFTCWFWLPHRILDQVFHFYLINLLLSINRDALNFCDNWNVHDTSWTMVVQHVNVICVHSVFLFSMHHVAQAHVNVQHPKVYAKWIHW
jgi:hypothetical protein